MVISSASCGTQASGIEECRQIENARCQSAAQCGLIDDVAACERYVRDQCLHGIPDDLGPSNSEVTACVEAIEDVGSCAKRLGDKADPSNCSQDSVNSATASRVCQLVERPERLEDCRFLGEFKAEKDSGGDDDEGNGDEGDDEASVTDAAAPEPAKTPSDAAADAAP